MLSYKRFAVRAFDTIIQGAFLLATLNWRLQNEGIAACAFLTKLVAIHPEGGALKLLLSEASGLFLLRDGRRSPQVCGISNVPLEGAVLENRVIAAEDVITSALLRLLPGQWTPVNGRH